MTFEAPATKPLASTTLALAPDPLAEVPREAQGDPTYGWEMFAAFTCAALAVTFAVCVLALVGSWWMLGVAVAAHIGLTATMMWLVFTGFGASEHAYPDMHSAEAASRAAISARAGLAPRARSRLAVEH